MSDCMTFPDTVEEFMEQYKIVDTEQIYTNGTELVPIFRMKQWFEHQPSITQKTGRWRNVARFSELIVRLCSECGYATTTYNPPNYCEFCGSKNVGDNNVDNQCKCCKDLESIL